MDKIYIGIDNGITGTIGIISSTEIKQYHMPVKKELNYTKTKQFLNRIDGIKLTLLLEPYINREVLIGLERPMINPTRWKASVSAIRALEATLIVIESCQFPYVYLDSKEWQREMLPSGLQKEELKIASMQVGQRLFPKIDFLSFDDADGILIAKYLQKKKM